MPVFVTPVFDFLGATAKRISPLIEKQYYTADAGILAHSQSGAADHSE
jgi:hypothetical protein